MARWSHDLPRQRSMMRFSPREHIPGADRGHHRAGDHRPNPGHAHQPLATGILARDGFDLVRQTLNPLVESVPVAGQIFDNAQHARRQDIWWRGQDARQLGAQEPLSLPHRNAALQQEGADLIDNAGTLADQALPYPGAVPADRADPRSSSP